MGKRGASAAAASGADDGNHVDEAEADDLMVRLARWRSEHPTRAYVGAPLEHVRKKLGMPTQVSQTLAGGVHTRLKKAGGVASSAASGAPAECAILEEVVCIPFAQKIPQGEEIKEIDEFF